MGNNPLLKLQEYGQSIWLDYLHRQSLNSGELLQMIETDGIRGVTTNPQIFQKAIGDSEVYNDAIRELARQGQSAEEIYQVLIVEDVRRAADLFRPLYDKSDGHHGFVSLEVNPHLAHDTGRTIEEARQFWRLLARPNVFIKVPATKAGLPAIRQLISEGINVNVTLLFGLPRYRAVAEAFIDGLEDRVERGGALTRLASVASFFLSRIDLLIDPQLEEKIKAGSEQAEMASRLRGQIAIASAREAYQIYKEIFSSPRFEKLTGHGGRPQRVLWASTSTKNPDYSDVKYVETLIGPETVNTVPMETLKAYRDHGQPAARLEEDPAQARGMLADLAQVGIDLDQATRQLEEEGVEKFIQPYDQLLQILAERRGAGS